MGASVRPARAGFLWSNPGASTETLIRMALVRPTFDRLLALAIDRGVVAIEREWDALREEGSVEAERSAGSVERILKHIKAGFQRAHAAS